MNYSPSVIAVDDTLSELNHLVDTLSSLEIACLPIHVKEGVDVNLSAPLSGVRLIFFDINYVPGAPSRSLMEIAGTVLTKVLAKDNGPYLLITWTSKPDVHDELMVFLAKEVPEAPIPAITACLPKEKFILSNDRGTEIPGASGGQSLKAAIESILSAHTQVNALLQWEGAAKRAAGEVISSLLDLFDREQRFKNASSAALGNLLSFIAKKAVGEKNVAGNEKTAVNEALGPILFDRITHQSTSASEHTLWAAALTSISSAFTITPEHTHKLNSLNHIAYPGSGKMLAGDRGVVFLFPPDAGQEMARRANVNLQDLADSYLDHLAPGGKPPGPADLLFLSQSCRWVLIGTRAICDEANSRGLLRPVVLGLEIPVEVQEKGFGSRIKKHGALHVSPTFFLPRASGSAGKSKRILLNWHWQSAIGSAEIASCIPVYRLRESITNLFCAALSDYSARLGIVSYD